MRSAIKSLSWKRQASSPASKSLGPGRRQVLNPSARPRLNTEPWRPYTHHVPPERSSSRILPALFGSHGDRHSDPPSAPPAWRPGPPAPPTRVGHAGGITGGGDGAGCTPPLPPTPLQAGGGGEGGNRERGSRGRRKSGLEEGWGLCREGGAGPSRRTGRGGFPEPVRGPGWSRCPAGRGGMVEEAGPGCCSRSRSVSGLSDWGWF